MATSKIEQIIDEIEEYIDSCKYAAFSSTNILVNKEELESLLEELRRKTPDEIKRYQKIISNKEAIMDDARKKADSMVKQATVYTEQMVDEHTIMQQAYAQAGEIVEQARQQAQQIIDTASAQANEIQYSAMQYTDDSLASIQAILGQSINETQEHNAQLVDSLNQILNVVNMNRAELHPEEGIAQDEAIADRAEAERAEAERMYQNSEMANAQKEEAAPQIDAAADETEQVK